MNPFRFAVVTAVASLVAAAPATAGFRKVAVTHKDDILSAMSVLDARHFFVGGMRLEQKGGFPVPATVLYRTQDGGKTFSSILTNLAGMGGLLGGVVTDVQFLKSNEGFALLGDSVFRVDAPGGQWKETRLSATPRRIHMFDAMVGVVAGDGGMTWRTEDGGESFVEHPAATAADLGCMFWLDRERGFAAGQRTEELEGEDPSQTRLAYREAVLLRTSDGGRTWSVTQLPDGQSVCPISFLPDGKTGFLATADQDPDLGRPGPAHLMKTTDGGATFTDMDLDVRVGTGMFNMPIFVSYFLVMHWTDADHGVLGGDAYVMDASSGMGGSTPPIYRVVDFRTSDGGATWQKTDLGTIQVDFGGGQLPPTDGRVLSGRMLSLAEGWMAGETGAVFAYELPCTDHSECGPGYACGGEGTCVPVLTPEGCAGAECQQPGGRPGSDDPAPAADGAETVPDATGPAAPECGEGACGEAPSGGGCAAGVTPGGGHALVLLALGLASLRRHRRRPGG